MSRRFAQGDRVSWRALYSKHVFHGHVVRLLVEGYALVEDETGLPPYPLRESRLEKSCRFRSRGGVAA